MVQNEQSALIHSVYLCRGHWSDIMYLMGTVQTIKYNEENNRLADQKHDIYTKIHVDIANTIHVFYWIRRIQNRMRLDEVLQL